LLHVYECLPWVDHKFCEVALWAVTSELGLVFRYCMAPGYIAPREYIGLQQRRQQCGDCDLGLLRSRAD
jgi:hypothetical protein